MNEIARFLLHLPPQASTVSRDIDFLHYGVVSVTMLGAFTVFAFAIYFIIKYRRGRAPNAPTARVQGNLMTEVVVITTLLSLFLLIWVIGFRQFIGLRRVPDDAIEVYATGKQWMWEFAYPSGPGSKGVLYVPVDRPVKVFITSRDVLHSFFVPAFRLKQDAVPGQYTVIWFEANQVGRYPLYCAEYCGASHSKMLAEIVVLSQADYAAWLDAPLTHVPQAVRGPARVDLSPQRGPTLVEQGKTVAADVGCLRCHTLDGSNHIGPTWRGLYASERTLGNGTQVVADEAYLTESMMDPLAKIVAGFAPVMPTYRGRITPIEVAAILELIKSLRVPDHKQPLLDPQQPDGTPTETTSWPN